ncbi:hypothetical protein BOTBODRAFT_174222 [Botryobasidium botryosum FD-172 SS1]|uniref:Uncharacterized protein n=1 Tax=Botryobasidium botryosum (strain FD-172 SS1) TaxID=930990 RepID=A0A067MGX0_BOTB1|nr:hypothetical protein BOTBODRAFT_174222 [Botryobasidium botryosum FD-172 SS1]
MSIISRLNTAHATQSSNPHRGTHSPARSLSSGFFPPPSQLGHASGASQPDSSLGAQFVPPTRDLEENRQFAIQLTIQHGLSQAQTSTLIDFSQYAHSIQNQEQQSFNLAKTYIEGDDFHGNVLPAIRAVLMSIHLECYNRHATTAMLQFFKSKCEYLSIPPAVFETRQGKHLFDKKFRTSVTETKSAMKSKVLKSIPLKQCIFTVV